MFQFTFRRNRTAVVGMIAVGMAIALSSFSIVRAEHVKPDSSITYTCSSGTACVEGDSTSSTTLGVYGLSTGDGVKGVTSSTTEAGLAGVAGIASGTSGNAYGVHGTSTNAAGVYGTSVNSYGVEGLVSNSDGVHGVTTSTGNGVAGYANGHSIANNGVYGKAISGNGVEGQTTSGYGVYGLSTESSGVFGDSTTSPGVEGGSSQGVGVEGLSLDTTGTYAGVEADADKSNGRIFYGENFVTGKFCLMDYDANLTCSGEISGSVVQTRHRNSNGKHVLTYASESASQTIEDVGTAKMYGGVANVQIDPDFASVMDHKWYYVFLTPLGDTRGLYVSTKAPTAFQVRETERGRSTLEFDYRIVAHPLDANGERLPPAPVIRRPKPPTIPAMR